MKKKKVCPECGGHGGIYPPEFGIGPNGDIMGIPCPTCCPESYGGLDDLPCDYQIVANAIEASKENKK